MVSKLKDVTYRLNRRTCRVVTAVAMPCDRFGADNFPAEYVARKVSDKSLSLFTKERLAR